MSTITAASPIFRSFAVERTGDTQFRGHSVPDERRPVVFGGQIMGQMIAAASSIEPDKRVKSLHVIFARAGTVKMPVEVALQPVHSGRAFASVAATARQGERVLSEATILLDSGEPDVIRHQTPQMPDVSPEDPSLVTETPYPGVELRVVGNVDLMTADVTGPPELLVWTRWSDVPDEVAMHQGALAWYTDPFLIGAAMRPHDGIGYVHAHDTISTGVIAHTLTFHEPFRADQWLLIANRSLHAGNGRTYGEGHVFTEAGQLVASFTQINIIRRFRDEDGARGKDSMAM